MERTDGTGADVIQRCGEIVVGWWFVTFDAEEEERVDDVLSRWIRVAAQQFGGGWTRVRRPCI
jgi:hypothetical protein